MKARTLYTFEVAGTVFACLEKVWEHMKTVMS